MRWWGFLPPLLFCQSSVFLTSTTLSIQSHLRALCLTCSSVWKSHHADARCISGYGNAISANKWFALKKVRKHNRQIHKLKILPGGIRKNNQAAYVVKGFRLFDKVRFRGQECFIFGRRNSGSFDVRTLNGTTISSCAGYRKLTLLEKASSYLWERRTA